MLKYVSRWQRVIVSHSEWYWSPSHRLCQTLHEIHLNRNIQRWLYNVLYSLKCSEMLPRANKLIHSLFSENSWWAWENLEFSEKWRNCRNERMRRWEQKLWRKKRLCRRNHSFVNNFKQWTTRFIAVSLSMCFQDANQILTPFCRKNKRFLSTFHDWQMKRVKLSNEGQTK